MSYDNWKLASPDDLGPYDELDDPCEHSEYEVDILTGQASCTMCDHRWFMSDAEIARDQELQRQHVEMVRCFGCDPPPAFWCAELRNEDEIPF